MPRSESATMVAPQLHEWSFPFRSELSLEPLMVFWQQTCTSDHPVHGKLAATIQEALRQAPELLAPIEDLAVITRHRKIVDLLMTVAFPQAFWDQTYTAALMPFQFRVFYATPSFERLLMDQGSTLRGRMHVDEQTVEHVRILHAYLFILHQVYGIEREFDYPLILTAPDRDTDLDRHFKMQFDGRFMEVKTVGEVPQLSEAVTQRLLANLADPQVLMEVLPPEHFVLHGFAVLNATEVTEQEVLSSLERDLIEKESIISRARFRGLQDKLRTLFRKPDLLLGLAAIQGNQVFMLSHGATIEYG
jgi:hypothetical protein